MGNTRTKVDSNSRCIAFSRWSLGYLLWAVGGCLTLTSRRLLSPKKKNIQNLKNSFAHVIKKKATTLLSPATMSAHQHLNDMPPVLIALLRMRVWLFLFVLCLHFAPDSRGIVGERAPGRCSAGMRHPTGRVRAAGGTAGIGAKLCGIWLYSRAEVSKRKVTGLRGSLRRSFLPCATYNLFPPKAR